MRGRTNITPRTGPAVIGNLVTQKQVTGSKIEVGDFVEFTGDTSIYEELSSQFNFSVSSFFEIGNGIYGCSYFNSSNQFRFIIFDINGIIKITDLSSIYVSINSSYNPNSYDFRNLFKTTYYDGKIYVCVSQMSVDYVQGKSFVYVFNLNQETYSVSYDSEINLDILPWSEFSQSYYISVTPFVKDGYIYVLYNATYPRFFKLTLDGTIILNSYTSSINIAYAYAYETENFIFIKQNSDSSSGDTDSNAIIYDIEQNTFKEVENFPPYMLYGNIKEKDGIFICAGFYRSGTVTNPSYVLYIYAFYIDSNGEVNVLSRTRQRNSNSYAYCLNIFVEHVDGVYKINVTDNYAYNNRNYLRFFYFEFENNTFGSYEKSINIVETSFPVKKYEQTMFVKDSNIFNLFLTESVNLSETNNYLLRTKYLVVNDQIIMNESFDLVKKYQNRIDGVAKIGGSAGQLISVYIP